MSKVLFVLSIIPLAYSMIEINGKCPEIKPVERFDGAAFTSGLWYQVARYETDWEKKGDCVTMEFQTDKSGIKFNLTVITKGIPNYIIGVIDNPEQAKTYGLVEFDSSAFKDAEGREVLFIYTLDTDNHNYAICYECRYNKKNNTSLVAAWLLSRTNKLEGDAKTAVDNYLKTSELVDASKLVWDHFTDEACQIKV